MSLAAGTRLGTYEIEGPIGAGGMGEVYRARDTKLDRDVAIKVLPTLFADDLERIARFEREAKSVAQLSHPNILAIHDFGQQGSTAYAVTELLDGETLRERLAAGRAADRAAGRGHGDRRLHHNTSGHLEGGRSSRTLAGRKPKGCSMGP